LKKKGNFGKKTGMMLEKNRDQGPRKGKSPGKDTVVTTKTRRKREEPVGDKRDIDRRNQETHQERVGWKHEINVAGEVGL